MSSCLTPCLNHNYIPNYMRIYYKCQVDFICKTRQIHQFSVILRSPDVSDFPVLLHHKSPSGHRLSHRFHLPGILLPEAVHTF